MSKINALICAAALVVPMLSCEAIAQPAASDRELYYVALKCYVVAGNASIERKEAGDQAKAAAYEAKAHHDYDLAVKLGWKVRGNGSYIEGDIAQTQEEELSNLVKDPNYNRQSAAVCKAVGLL